MCRGFQLFQSVDPQIVMQPLGLDWSDSRNRLEKQDRDRFRRAGVRASAAGRFPPCRGRRSPTVANGGNPLQALDTFARVESGHGLRQTSDRHGSVPIRVHPERIGALGFEQSSPTRPAAARSGCWSSLQREPVDSIPRRRRSVSKSLRVGLAPDRWCVRFPCPLSSTRITMPNPRIAGALRAQTTELRAFAQANSNCVLTPSSQLSRSLGCLDLVLAGYVLRDLRRSVRRRLLMPQVAITKVKDADKKTLPVFGEIAKAPGRGSAARFRFV